jgi:hypothetical protein
VTHEPATDDSVDADREEPPPRAWMLAHVYGAGAYKWSSLVSRGRGQSPAPNRRLIGIVDVTRSRHLPFM